MKRASSIDRSCVGALKASTILGSLLVCVPAFGQSAPATPSSQPPATAIADPAAPNETQEAQQSAPNVASGGEVIVTARKRSESITSVPLAVSAIGGEGLAARAVLSPVQLNDFVPGFRLSPSVGPNTARTFSNYIMRGLNPNSSHPDRQNVGVFIDGISIGGAGMIPGLANVDRVEVVKGPQSAYFGRATFGGAVNYVTKAPSLIDYSGGVDVTLTSRGSIDQRAYVEGPIIRDRLSIRLDGERNIFKSGYRNFGYDGTLGDQNSESFAATIRAEPIDALRLRGFYTAWSNHDGPNATQYLTAAGYNCNPRGGPNPTYYCGGFSDLPASTISQNTTVPAATLQALKARDQVLGDDFPFELGLKRLAHFGYVSADADMPHGFTLSGYYAFDRIRYSSNIDAGQRFETGGRVSDSLTSWDVGNNIAEARLTSNQDKPFKAMLGFNYFEQSTFANSFVYRNGVFTTALAPQRQDTKTYGIFGSLSWDVTDRLTASAEARWQDDQVESSVVNGTALSGSTKSFSPRATLSYELTRKLNLYASYAQGTRPAQFNTAVYSLSPADQGRVLDQADVPLVVPEEKIKMVETGLRGSLFDNKLTILTAVYYGWWRDRQAQTTIVYNRASDNAINSVLGILPNGRVDVYGVELEATARVTSQLTLEGSFAYNETEIKSSICPECAVITGVVNNVGNRIPAYASQTASAAATYTVPISDDWDAFIRADYIHSGRIYETEANLAWTDPANRINLRIGLNTDRYRFELFAINLTNSKVPLGVARSTDTYNGANVLAFAPPPLWTIGLRFAADFR